MNLKPQDIVVALKLLSYRQQRPPFSVMANELGLSPSEVHGAMKRLQSAKLIHGSEMENRPNISALEEFLLHGVKYSFPAQHGSVTRGVATSYAASPLKAEITAGDELPPIWPWAEGDTRGVALEPLYKTVPAAALRDPVLYEFLAIVDAIRDGRARERKIAERELMKRIRPKNAQSQP